MVFPLTIEFKTLGWYWFICSSCSTL